MAKGVVDWSVVCFITLLLLFGTECDGRVGTGAHLWRSQLRSCKSVNTPSTIQSKVALLSRDTLTCRLRGGVLLRSRRSESWLRISVEPQTRVGAGISEGVELALTLRHTRTGTLAFALAFPCRFLLCLGWHLLAGHFAFTTRTHADTLAAANNKECNKKEKLFSSVHLAERFGNCCSCTLSDLGHTQYLPPLA
jgi:hypothetical protein